ncbi:Transglutaminase superfamily enzyme [Halalkaliarchaeum sp. AArc-CO]|uniref:lasso peptide biosynthesis B2 protein n=1 Tax=Halalkaliarchaeum sp. AArc-CO TaxID=2866381 RepID=UPI00217DF2AD|nr:lasso peptide biosynthesis B2 protein [Halalkaliarchaeum sp. AArc-CO]UWG50335.1 Transglutaminase superfamily enzyme [Halalkaliarchaeum sp. AArc-CO]
MNIQSETDRPSRTLIATAAVLLSSTRLLLPVLRWDATRRIVEPVAARAPPFRQVAPGAIAAAVEAVHRRAPFSPTCLMKAIVGKALLEANGHRAELKLGVTRKHGEFHAHAWIERDGSVLIGELDDLAEYRILTERDADRRFQSLF